MRRALAFLTPLFGASEPRPETLTWFPFAGAALGLVLGGVWWGAERVWPAAVAAAIVVVADLAAHRVAARRRPRRLRRRLAATPRPDAAPRGDGDSRRRRVRRGDGRSGAPVALGIAGDDGAVAAAPRRAVVRVADGDGGHGPDGAVRAPGGLASSFLGRRALPAAVLGGALAVAMAFAGPGLPGAVAVGAVVVGAAGVVVLARRRIGGFTGDVLGASGMVGETAGLVVAAARW